jgi:hypothetical protein
MTETVTLGGLVIPGTYVSVRAEGLIGAGAVSTGNIGIVGTVQRGAGATVRPPDYATAETTFVDPAAGQTPNLMRGLELLFRNGARVVYARGVAAGASQAVFEAAFNELLKEDVNILVAPELSTQLAKAVLGPILERGENASRDTMAVIGCDATAVADIVAQVTADDRFIMTAPGVRVSDVLTLNGSYTAAAVAGLLSTLAPQSSPTNKVFPGVVALSQRFSYADTLDLVNGGVLVLEQRQGIRVVRGVTTEMAASGPFRQVTTRRIVDTAKAGIRSASDPFIGRLNNQRVRAALQGAIAGFLTSMVQDEALVGYDLQVTATRPDEIAGRAIVNAVLRPTFSIDFIAVTLVLE